MKVKVFVHRECSIERVGLRNNTDQAFGLCGVSDHVDTADDCSATRREHSCCEHSCSGALAGAIGAEKAEDLTAMHAEIESVDREDVAGVHLCEFLGDDDFVGIRAGCHWSLSSPSSAVSPLRSPPPRKTCRF